MTLLRTSGWRVALALSGVTMLIGGPMHPSADAEDSLREELATMTADPSWVPAHVFVVLSTLLLAVGLWVAHRRQAWPVGTRRTLKVAAVAISLYTVEAVFHLAAAVDSHELHHGDAAPVAFTHVGLSVLLYPIAGIAVAALAARQVSSWPGLRKAAGVPGVVAGLLHASSVPLTLLLPDTELGPVFAGAAISLAVWALATAVTGAPRPVRTETTREPLAV
jgi:hypothetical protein